MSNRILITGGRAPVALELARMFHKTGHTVYGAESIYFSLLWNSRSVKKNFMLPSPRFHFSEYSKKLIEIIKRENIELLIPTCEEIFYIANRQMNNSS